MINGQKYLNLHLKNWCKIFYDVNIVKINKEQRKIIESAVLNRLIKHLQDDKDLQNIDLMNLAGFCRNCIAKWYTEEAKINGIRNVNYESVREIIYGMPYEEWKKKYQKPLKPK